MLKTILSLLLQTVINNDVSTTVKKTDNDERENPDKQ